MRLRFRACIVAVFTLGGVHAHAQIPAVGAIEATAIAVDDKAQTPQANARLSWSDFLDPQDGQLDMSKFLATPRAFLPVPVIITEPAVG